MDYQGPEVFIPLPVQEIRDAVSEGIGYLGLFHLGKDVTKKQALGMVRVLMRS